MIIRNFLKMYHENNDDVKLSGAVRGETVSTKNFPKEESIIYEEIERDPFRMATEKMPERKTAVIKKIKMPTVPNLPEQIKYRINGVIIHPDERLVIFEDLTSMRTIFLRESDEYKGIAVKKIEIGHVVLIEKGFIKMINIRDIVKLNKE